jgi:hypothetical protein
MEICTVGGHANACKQKNRWMDRYDEADGGFCNYANAPKNIVDSDRS